MKTLKEYILKEAKKYSREDFEAEFPEIFRQISQWARDINNEKAVDLMIAAYTDNTEFERLSKACDVDESDLQKFDEEYFSNVSDDERERLGEIDMF